MFSIPRFAKVFEGYETVDFKEFLEQGRIEIHLEVRPDKAWVCFRCGTQLAQDRGRYRIRLEHLPVGGIRSWVYLWRRKGYCPRCRKARSEAVEFVAQESPHLTGEYAWWIGRICEFAPISRVAELLGQDETTTWRVDLRRMRRMLQYYKIPEVTAISVDEVYARKKSRFAEESRNERFFTVVSDLRTGKVIWVSESRSQRALDQFFVLLGEDACKKIEVIAMDQHDEYLRSAKTYCPGAKVVWDRFHLMQNFEEAVNETRKDLHEELPRAYALREMTRGQYRYIFLKKETRRTEQERLHINQVLQANQKFAKLEIIKERMFSFFDQPSEQAARQVFEEIGDWIWQEGFRPLIRWLSNFDRGWETAKNYFTYRVTTSLSEGVNNVIKALKRRAYGYRNMEYFRLKIMQVCGYLNSRFIPTHHQLVTQI